jgi:hypothetical protein
MVKLELAMNSEVERYSFRNALYFDIDNESNHIPGEERLFFIILDLPHTVGNV